jgi:hypothetical protein
MVGSVKGLWKKWVQGDEYAHPVPFANGHATYWLIGCYIARSKDERLEILENETFHSHKRDLYSSASTLSHLHSAAKRKPFPVAGQDAGER